MKRTPEIDKPFNFGYQIMHNEFPEELHININAPGIYERTATNTRVLNLDGGGDMDVVDVVGPDFNRLFVRAVSNGEHQSTAVTKPKSHQISRYALQSMYDEKLPAISYVVSNIPTKDHYPGWEITPSLHLKTFFIELDEKDNTERLNRIKNIINKQEELTDLEALNLGIIPLFAPKTRACEVTEEVVELYAEVHNQLNIKMEKTLYSVLYAMVDAYFLIKEDYDRVMKMLNTPTTPKTKNEFQTWNIIRNRNKMLEDAFKKVSNENAELKAENSRIHELYSINAELNSRIVELEAENSRIVELEAEIERLKYQYNGK